MEFFGFIFVGLAQYICRHHSGRLASNQEAKNIFTVTETRGSKSPLLRRHACVILRPRTKSVHPPLHRSIADRRLIPLSMTCYLQLLVYSFLYNRCLPENYRPLSALAEGKSFPLIHPVYLFTKKRPYRKQAYGSRSLHGSNQNLRNFSRRLLLTCICVSIIQIPGLWTILRNGGWKRLLRNGGWK